MRAAFKIPNSKPDSTTPTPTLTGAHPQDRTRPRPPQAPPGGPPPPHARGRRLHRPPAPGTLLLRMNCMHIHTYLCLPTTYLYTHAYVHRNSTAPWRTAGRRWRACRSGAGTATSASRTTASRSGTCLDIYVDGCGPVAARKGCSPPHSYTHIQTYPNTASATARPRARGRAARLSLCSSCRRPPMPRRAASRGTRSCRSPTRVRG